MIKVVIVEDESLVRLGIKACIEADDNFVVSGAFATAEEAEEQIEKIPVDILLTDIRLPKKSGLELMRDIREKIPRALFIVLSCYEDFSYAQKAIEYGAVRYLLKHDLDETKLPLIISELIAGREIYDANLYTNTKPRVKRILSFNSFKLHIFFSVCINPFISSF